MSKLKPRGRHVRRDNLARRVGRAIARVFRVPERIGYGIESLRYFDYPISRISVPIECDCGHKGWTEANTYEDGLVVWDCPACAGRFSASVPDLADA